MKVIVIPDVHLKPWMFDRASRIMQKGQAELAVCLMDLADDWMQQYISEQLVCDFSQSERSLLVGHIVGDQRSGDVIVVALIEFFVKELHYE